MAFLSQCLHNTCLALEEICCFCDCCWLIVAAWALLFLYNTHLFFCTVVHFLGSLKRDGHFRFVFSSDDVATEGGHRRLKHTQTVWYHLPTKWRPEGERSKWQLFDEQTSLWFAIDRVPHAAEECARKTSSQRLWTLLSITTTPNACCYFVRKTVLENKITPFVSGVLCATRNCGSSHFLFTTQFILQLQKFYMHHLY